MDPDRACPHLEFEAQVNVNRLLPSGSDEADNTIVPHGYAVEIRVSCKDCGEPFRWVGVPAGMSPARPTCRVDETELRAPIRPASSDPDFGLGLPGYAIQIVER